MGETISTTCLLWGLGLFVAWATIGIGLIYWAAVNAPLINEPEDWDNQ